MNKKNSQSKSLEEISTISTSVEKMSRSAPIRHSLQTVPQEMVHQRLRHTMSHNYGKSRKLPPTIPECDQTDDEDEPVNTGDNPSLNSAVRGSQISKKSVGSRKVSVASKRRDDISGYDNTGYDNSLDGVSVRSNRSLDRDPRLGNSALSSTRTSSLSLEVQREQYCCFSRWSPCERKLAALVAVLATIIVILVIVVGLLAGEDAGVDTKFMWAM